MRLILLFWLALATLPAIAQNSTPVMVPGDAISQLEDLMEATKTAASSKVAPGKKIHAEARPDVNRLLIISADDFRRVVREKPTREAFLECLDKGLARVAPLTADAMDRQQVADFYQELVEIVGLRSSEGRLTQFVASGAVKQ